MKISMHNRMRAEPLEVTVARLARCGYDAIEISGEPARYDPREVRPLLKRHRVCCCGSVTLMTDGLDLISPDPAVRQNSVQNIMDRTPLGAQQYGDASVVGVSDAWGWQATLPQSRRDG
jgi:sugar phosphate isomerase/epimerase